MPTDRVSAARLVSAAALGAALVAALPAAADETRVRARYDMTLAGFEIGSASMQAGIDKAAYDVNLSLRMTGLARFITGGKGAATARGAWSGGQVAPSAYAVNTRAGSKGQIIRFALAGGAVSQLSVEPPPKTKGIVPVSDADKRNIVDPLSAVFMPVTGAGDPLDPSSCNRTLPIFDGRQRFDVTLRYDRAETATAAPDAKGSYGGKLIVCKASYRAISGHRPGREQVKFMEANKDMEVWLAPVAGTRTLLPWKISVRTQMGTLEILASSFTTGADASLKPAGGADL